MRLEIVVGIDEFFGAADVRFRRDYLGPFGIAGALR
jgi:hypothetical protein